VAALARRPGEQRAVLTRLADTFEQLGRSPDARGAHERAAALDPDFRASLLWLARDDLTRGDHAAAEARFRRLLGRADASADERREAALALARIAGDAGRERDADRALALAFEIDPDA